MDSRYNPRAFEPVIYQLWEKSGYFNPDNLPITENRSPKIGHRKPYTILLPPPNASGKMHTGNVLMIAIEDLLIRWKRMQGFAALWLPGTDHAGFETQVTFERELKKQGKSRFQFDRQTLYNMIWEFVQKNKADIENQIKSMGASVDWSRYTFTLDDHVIKTVHETFKKMHDEGLIYRDDYMVNYCPVCGTTFADLEVVYKERIDPLVYVRYQVADRQDKEPDYLVIATVRPETIALDTHIAVNPKDKKRNKWIGRKALNPMTKQPMEIIGDEFVDPKFGTGIVKLTPAHDKNDYEVGKRHKLPMVSGIELSGKMNSLAGVQFEGLKVKPAREKAILYLTEENLIEKVDDKYNHTVALCYKGEHDIEPMIVPNWFVKVDYTKKSLKKPAYDAVKQGKVKIYPKWREKTYLRWMEEMHDWPISRQVVWGIRIPAWYSVNDNPDLVVTFVPKNVVARASRAETQADQGSATTSVTGKISDLLKDYSFTEIESGLQRLFAPQDAKFTIQSEKPNGQHLPETDTFDTWFSSGQWPLVTLHYPNSKDFKRFYPTSILETGWEIIRLWVSRMVMFGMYKTGKPPFHDVYLHGIVRATDGRKMSKSLGNVINPEDYQKEFGTDALRMGLISGTAGGKDFNFPKDKVLAYRNFANKLWNIGRFILIQIEENNVVARPWRADNLADQGSATTKEDKAILKKLNSLIKKVTTNLEKYRFAQAAEDMYHFVWNDFASDYLEKSKEKFNDPSIHQTEKAHILNTEYRILDTVLKLLHPFMPFVTEAIWQEMNKELKQDNEPLMIQQWPILSK